MYNLYLREKKKKKKKGGERERESLLVQRATQVTQIYLMGEGKMQL